MKVYTHRCSRMTKNDIASLTLSVIRAGLPGHSNRCLCGVVDDDQHGRYTRAPSSAAAAAPPPQPPPPSRHRHRHRHRPERAREAIAVRLTLTFLYVRRGNEYGTSALLSTDSRGEYAAHFSPGGS